MSRAAPAQGDKLLLVADAARGQVADPSSTDAIDSRIGVHDRNQFEVKLDYTVDPSRRRNRYRVDAYFFLPKSLGINRHTYGTEQFYSDVHAYIRFKTPTFPLNALLDPNNRDSPLFRVKDLSARVLHERKGRKLHDTISRDLRLLGCLVRAHVRDRVTALCRDLKDIRDTYEQHPILLDDVRTSVLSLNEEWARVRESLRDLRPTFMQTGMSQALREAYQYVDEYVSLVVQMDFTKLLEAIDEVPGLRDLLAQPRTAVVQRILEERSYRSGAGYPSVIDEDPDSENELFIYRRGILKKFVMSVLFLEIEKQKEGQRLAHLSGGFAAGVAMLFSTLLAVWTHTVYAFNSIPFILALVVIYIGKDRIKDSLKQFLASKATRWLYDYSVKIHDPSHRANLGRCREVFSFVERSGVPPAVMGLRNADAKTSIERESKPEVILHYGKEISVTSKVLGKLHGDLHDINDIIRFNVVSFLARMDDPTLRVRTYSTQRDAVVYRQSAKTYHMNVVFVFSSDGRGSSVSLRRVRVVLDRNGIRRMEIVVPGQ